MENAAGGTPRYSIQGRTVEMPVVVRDATSCAVTYLVNAKAARRLLPGDEIELVELLPGRALLNLAVIEYRDNDLGDYNEVSIAFFVRAIWGHVTRSRLAAVFQIEWLSSRLTAKTSNPRDEYVS